MREWKNEAEQSRQASSDPATTDHRVPFRVQLKIKNKEKKKFSDEKEESEIRFSPLNRISESTEKEMEKAG